MSVGSTGKWFALGFLVASLGATGCKDDGDDDVDTVDSGPKDSGTPAKDSGSKEDAGKEDAGASDAAADTGPTAVMCGGKSCASHTTSAGTFAAGCALDAKDAEVCGISTALIFGDAGGPAYLEIHAPGAASASCGAVLDNLDTLQDGGVANFEILPDGGRLPKDSPTKGNAMLDRFISVGAASIKLATPGCCTPIGTCSGNTDIATAYLDPTSDAGITSNGGFGCMASAQFLRTAPESVRAIPCDVDSGVVKSAPVVDAGADAGSDAGASDASADAAGG